MARTVEGDASRFNARFYEGDPAAYIKGRLDQWMRSAEEASAFSVVRVRSSTHPGISDISEVDRGVLSFLTTDAVVLHHHAAETVVRYFLAHLDDHPVPWTEIAGRRGRDFNQLVRKALIDSSPSPEDVATIVYGMPAPQPFAQADEWADAVERVVEFLVDFAHTHLDGAPMYNSLKHGLGAGVGRTDIVLVEDIADVSRPTVAEIGAGHRLGSGPRVEYPTFPKRKDPGDATEWSIVTEWVDVERSIRMIQVAIGLLGSIRSVGRHRRGVADDDGGSTVVLSNPGPFRPSTMRSAGRTPAHRLSQVLLRLANTT